MGLGLLELIGQWVLKFIFRKKDPAAATEEMLRDQAIHAQKQAPSADDAVDSIK